MQAPFPLFGALNVPYRIIELLHTNRHRELLSGRPEVQILLATPDNPPKTQYLCGFSVFFIFEILFDFGKRLEFSAKTSSFLIEIFKTSRQMVC